MPAQTYRRIDLALEQLDVALMLFLERGDFPAVITLAGAAEEVLGKEVNRRGWQVALHRRVNRYAEQDRKAAIPAPLCFGHHGDGLLPQREVIHATFRKVASSPWRVASQHAPATSRCMPFEHTSAAPQPCMCSP